MLTAVFASTRDPTLASTSDPTIGPPDPWYSFAYRCNACESPTKATCNVVSRPPTYTCPTGKATTCADPASPKLHVCPRYMLGSAEFAAAVALDGLADTFNYAVAGHDVSATNPLEASGEHFSQIGAGQCYEMHFETDTYGIGASAVNATRKPLIVQTFNSVAGGPNRFDIYMAAGGYGNFDSCRADSAFAHNAALGDWVYAKYPTLKNRTIGGMQGGTGGGLRGGAAYAQAGKQVPTAPYPSGCTDPNVGEYCASSAADCTTFGGQPAFVGAAGSYVGGAAKLSCEAAFSGNYHWNGQVQKLRRVQCPHYLTRVTGLARVDTSLPKAGDASGSWTTNYTGSDGKAVPYLTTTMEDCCQGTYLRSMNVEDNGGDLDKEYNVMYSCGADGTPFVLDTAEPPSPPAVGLLLALYNANVTTDWVAVARAAQRVPVRAIVPVKGVSPPDPDWAPDYPSEDAYRAGVAMLRSAGVEVYAYTHLRNISTKCCSCCGNLTQFEQWVDTIKSSAGVF